VGSFTFTGTNAIPNRNYSTLTLNGGGVIFTAATGTLHANQLTVTSGTLAMGANTLTADAITNSGLVTVSTGDMSGIPVGEVGSFTFTGTNAIPNRNYSTLTLNGGGVTFAAATGTLHADQLTVTSGTLAMGANTLTADAITNSGLITVSTGDMSGIPTGEVGNFTFTSGNEIPYATYTTLDLTGAFTTESDVTATTLTINSGSLTFGAGENLTVSGVLTNPGTIKMGSGAIDFGSSVVNSGTIEIANGAITDMPSSIGGIFKYTEDYDVKAAGYTGTLNLSKAAGAYTAAGNITAGTLTIASGAGFTFSTGETLTVSTTLNNSGLITVANGAVSLPGGISAGNFTFKDANTIPSAAYSALRIDAAAKILTAGGNISATDLTIDNGTLNGNGKTISISGTFTNNGAFEANYSTLDYTGSGAQAFDPAKITAYTLAHSGLGSLTLNGSVTLTGNFSTTGGAFNTGGNNITISGDFTANSLFNPGSGTVSFNDINKISHVHGTTFNNLSITTPGKQIIVDASALETITGTLTLLGNASGDIFLSSSAGGIAWNIDPQGARNVDYITAKDVANINAATIMVNNFTSLGNTPGWNGIVPPAPSQQAAARLSYIPGENVLYRNPFKEVTEEPIGAFRYITFLVPVSAGPAIAVVPVTTIALAPAPRPLARPPSAITHMPIPPDMISADLFAGAYGTHIPSSFINSDMFVGVVPSVEMPSSANLFASVSVTQAALSFIDSDAFVNVVPAVEMPAPMQFAGISSASTAHTAASFEGVKNEVATPAIISPPAFSSIIPSVILDVPGAVRYFNGASEAFGVSKEFGPTDGNK
ncbi:MAG: hypothetical protein NTY34_06710, partial [Candidatus Omnitrophica bacterium]|nr:hypothetical protein [Candidatus Omnitrophota bacterium]